MINVDPMPWDEFAALCVLAGAGFGFVLLLWDGLR